MSVQEYRPTMTQNFFSPRPRAGLGNLMRQLFLVLRYLQNVDLQQEINSTIGRLEANQRELSANLDAARREFGDLQQETNSTIGRLEANQRELTANLDAVRREFGDWQRASGAASRPSSAEAGAPSRADFQPPQLPAGLCTIEIRDWSDDSVALLVVADPPSKFDELVYANRYVSTLAVLIKKWLRGRGTLLDVGAHIGTVALPVSLAGSRVVAVEMNPENCLRLVHGAIVNQLRDFRVVQVAATDFDGMAAFEGTDAWGRISNTTTALPTMCARLDTVAYSLECEADGAGFAEPLALKLDVEGHELRVLRGCPILLQRYRPLVIFESLEIEGRPSAPEFDSKAVKQLLFDLGYDLYLIGRATGPLIPRMPDDLQEAYTSDFLAVPREQAELVHQLDREVRPLTAEERLAWISEMANWHEWQLPTHAAGVILRLAASEPGFATAAKDIIDTLLRKPELEALWPRLSQLLP
jgi:FkbM family methyltransferase